MDDQHTDLTHSNCTSLDRVSLRQELRRRRRALNPLQQSQASMRALRQLLSMPQLMRAQHIALYMANDGELDPQIIAEQLWKMKKTLYLPVLRPKGRELWFVRYEPNSQLIPNRFGILEPEHRRQLKLNPNLLDFVLMPLVGFDRGGARLGMGGGFYDATFAFKQKQLKGRPYLVGLAHACQEVPKLDAAAWDIPLFAIATDSEVILVS
jgi:5-formyltetrahydrofolate cyclo-ligase